jgi:XapX domain-containing protein
MKILIGAIVAFVVGVGCRFFDIPVPSPPVLPGALLVVAMTLGYSATDRALTRKAQLATTKHLCGGPTGRSAADSGNDSNQRKREAVYESSQRG